MKLNDILVGMTGQRNMLVTEQTIKNYAELSGDYNPIHLDSEYAKTTRFGRCIAHGGIAAGLVSNVLGNELPGHGCVFLKQEIEYLKPVYVGDKICAHVEVVEIFTERHRILLRTKVTNQNNECVLEGKALMLHLQE